jgi:thiamine phosphate synthase YjbQ (UPF0047 family)|nr:YjbQ family protein [Thiocapsa sp.]
MIQENRDESVQQDVIAFLSQQIPKGVWRNDRQDGNGDAHLKAGLVGPECEATQQRVGGEGHQCRGSQDRRP